MFPANSGLRLSQEATQMNAQVVIKEMTRMKHMDIWWPCFCCPRNHQWCVSTSLRNTNGDIFQTCFVVVCFVWLLSDFYGKVVTRFGLFVLNFFFVFVVLGFELRSLYLEPLHQPYFCAGFCQERVLWTICPGWLRTMSLLISVSWVTRITCVSHWYLACI
jgi:hypothetical protein